MRRKTTGQSALSRNNVCNLACSTLYNYNIMYIIFGDELTTITKGSYYDLI